MSIALRLRALRAGAAAGDPPIEPPVDTSADRRITIWGQSNAIAWGAYMVNLSGSYATEAAPYLGVIDRVFIFNVSTGTYQPLDVGTNNQGGGESEGSAIFGPELGIAIRWMESTTTGNLYIDKHAVPSQQIAYFMKGNGSGFYEADQGYNATADAWLAAHGATPTEAGWVWVQGEGDTVVGTSQATYLSRLTTLIANRVSDGLQDASTSMNVLCRVGTGSSQYSAGVEAAKTDYETAHPSNTVCIDYVNSYVDGVHLGANAMLQLGYDAYDQMPRMPVERALWSELFASATDGDAIDVNVPVTFDMTSTPNYGPIVVRNGGGELYIDRTKNTSLTAHSLMIEGDTADMSNSGLYFLGSKAATGGIIDDPFPAHLVTHTFTATGPHSEESGNTIPTTPDGRGGGTNLTNPSQGVMSHIRSFTAMPGSRVFMECTTRPVLRFRLRNSVAAGATVLPVTPNVTVKAGDVIELGTSQYNSTNPALNLSKAEDCLTSNYGTERVVVAADGTNVDSITIIRDPAVAGTGLQFPHYGKLQYIVGKTRSGSPLEDTPGTNLSETDSGVLAGDFFGTTTGGNITGADFIAAMAGVVDGVTQTGAGGTRGRIVDHRSWGAILTRGVTFQGADDNDWWVHGYGFGLQGMGRTSIFQRGGIAIRRGGKAGILGNYASHDHIKCYTPYPLTGNGTHLGDVDPLLCYFERNSVYDSSNRGHTIHGTTGSSVKDNVFANIDTHCVFLEDGTEVDNVITGNIVIGVNRINTQAKRASAAHSVTVSLKNPIKVHDRLMVGGVWGDIQTSSLFIGQTDCDNNYPLGAQGPSAYWYSHPQNTFEDNVAIGAYTGIWNNFQRFHFGLSRNASLICGMRSEALTPAVATGTHNYCESGWMTFKCMTTNPHVYDEDGRLTAGPGGGSEEPQLATDNSYQFGHILPNRNDVADSERDWFTNHNFYGSDVAIYSNEAHDPIYVGWHAFGASGRSNRENYSHHDRLMFFGNGRPRFRGMCIGPNILHDPYPDAPITCMLSYGSGAIEHNNFFAPSTMTVIEGAGQSGLGANDELTQTGGVIHGWDFYVYAKSPPDRSLAGLCRNTVISGNCPGVPMMNLPPPFAYAMFGSNFTAIFDPTNPSQNNGRTSRSVQEAIQLPSDGSFMKMTGHWTWNHPFFTYGTIGTTPVTQTATVDTVGNMNGVIVPPAYDYVGIQVVSISHDGDQGVLGLSGFNGGRAPAITYTRMQADGRTAVSGGAWPIPKSPNDSIPWQNMRHICLLGGGFSDITFPNRTEVPYSAITGLVIDMMGQSALYGSHAGCHVLFKIDWNPATAVNIVRMMGYPAFKNVVNAGSEAALLSASVSSYWKDTTGSKLWFHIHQTSGDYFNRVGLDIQNAFQIQIRVNFDGDDATP